MAAIWQQLLRVERVGRLDNFFELGGHSLHTLRLVVKVAEHFMVDLPVHAVFRYPTILQMAEAVTFRLAAEQPTNLAEAEFEEGLI